MKEIKITFKTEKGEQAYYKVEEEGSKQPFWDRKISNAVAKDKIVSKNPLVVKIKIKVSRLAVHIRLADHVVQALKKFGAEDKIDYEMQVIY